MNLERRPGPPWIERNTAPGGIVLHVYVLEGPHMIPRLLLVRPLVNADAAEASAPADGELVARMIASDAPIVLVVYDGDTGERLKPEGVAVAW